MTNIKRGCSIRKISFVDFIHYKGYGYGDVVVGQNTVLDDETGEFRITLRIKNMHNGEADRYRISIKKNDLGKPEAYMYLVNEVMYAIQNMGYNLFSRKVIKDIYIEYEEVANMILDDILVEFEPIYMNRHKLYLGDYMFAVLDNFYKLKTNRKDD